MGNVIQFNENHKWCGCFGFIEEISGCFGFIEEIKGEKIMVGVPVPQEGTAYIFCKRTDFDVIGTTDLLPMKENYIEKDEEELKIKKD